MTSPPTIAVTFDDPALEPIACRLAARVGLACVAAPASSPTLLVVTRDGLELRDNSPRERGAAAPGAVVIDAPALERLAARRPNFRQPLARALSIETLRRELGRAPIALDATAGLLHDSALLISLGCAVVACERHAVLGAIIEDALERGLFASRPAFRFVPGDALAAFTAMSREGAGPDIVYFDPMHPPRREGREPTALVRKEMRTLRAVVGDDDDAPASLRALLGAAGAQPSGPGRTRRVVVKMPLRAPALIGLPRPVSTHKGKAVRYDVYSPHASR